MTQDELQVKTQWTQKTLQYFTDMSGNIIRTQGAIASLHDKMFSMMMDMSKDYEKLLLEVAKLKAESKPIDPEVVK